MQKIIHRFTASSKKGFGIHSPFVFNFQRKVLNPNLRRGQFYSNEANKVLRLLLRMTSYFNLNAPLLLNSEYRHGFEGYEIDYGTLPIKSSGYDLVVLNADDFFDENYLADEAFVVLKGKHAHIEGNPLRNKCNVFLDLYDVGICVFKKGLSRQEFKMKL